MPRAKTERPRTAVEAHDAASARAARVLGTAAPVAAVKPRRVLAMSPAAVKALARRWFLAGFRCSGEGAHGETALASSEAFEALLDAEFERAYLERVPGD